MHVYVYDVQTEQTVGLVYMYMCVYDVQAEQTVGLMCMYMCMMCRLSKL